MTPKLSDPWQQHPALAEATAKRLANEQMSNASAPQTSVCGNANCRCVDMGFSTDDMCSHLFMHWTNT